MGRAYLWRSATSSILIKPPSPLQVGPINGPSSTYQPPGSDEATNCRCSTVQYQLISACTICQGGLNASTWSTWTENCPQSLITKGFPRAVPTNTTIPSWAYLDPTISGIFDVNAALAANNLPIFPPATPSPAAAPSFPAPPPPGDNDSRPRINPAAAIGGALGGTLGIVGLAASAYFFMRHRSQRGKFRNAGPYNASSAAFSAHSGVPLAGVYPGPHFPGHGLASDPQLVNDSMMEFQLPSQHPRGRALGTLEYLPGSNPDRIAPGFTGRPEL